MRRYWNMLSLKSKAQNKIYSAVLEYAYVTYRNSAVSSCQINSVGVCDICVHGCVRVYVWVGRLVGRLICPSFHLFKCPGVNIMGDEPVAPLVVHCFHLPCDILLCCLILVPPTCSYTDNPWNDAQNICHGEFRVDAEEDFYPKSHTPCI